MQEQLSVFISSTSDLSEARDAVERGLRSRGIAASRYETWASSPNPPVPECLAKVAQADAMALIMGQKYRCGEGTGLSVTHEEYRHARKLRKDVFLFVLQADDREPEQEVFLREARGGAFHCAEILDIPALESEVTRAFAQDHARLRRSKPQKPATELKVEAAKTFQNVPARFRFIRVGPGRPERTVFQFYLKVRNMGQAHTSLSGFVLKVRVDGGEPWIVRDRCSSRLMPCRDHRLPTDVVVSNTLQRDDDLEAPPGPPTTVAMAMWTKQEVPDRITKLEGELTCTDFSGNTVSAPLTFKRIPH